MVEVLKAKLARVHRLAIEDGWNEYRHAKACRLAAKLKEEREAQKIALGPRRCGGCNNIIARTNKSGLCRNCRNPIFKRPTNLLPEKVVVLDLTKPPESDIILTQ